MWQAGGVADGSTLTDVLQLRRSHRDYAPGRVPDSDVEYILGCARRWGERCGFTSPRILAVPRGEDFDRITQAAVARLGVNMWLRSTPASHVLLCLTTPVQGQDLVRAVEEAAMCMHVAVLAATERGYGTCWMTGINHARVERTNLLPESACLIAISPLGYPTDTGDTLLYRFVPMTRKSVDEITMREVWQ